MRFLNIKKHDDASLYRRAAVAMGLEYDAAYEASISLRFKEFICLVGKLHRLPTAPAPLKDSLKSLKRLYDCSLQEVSEFKRSVRQDYGYGCPYCGEYCSTPDIDHYLPISVYGEFSLFSWNLVPSCTTCNRIFSARVADGADYIYPFGDSILRTPLLEVTFRWKRDDPVILLTVVDELPADLHDRVKRHVLMLNLLERFTRFGASQIVMLRRVGLQTTAGELRNQLMNEAFSYAATAGPNCWFPLLYNGIARDQQLVNWLVRPAMSEELP
ncbi:MAG: HNH endonuclease [Vulcanimicrobiaceae bacterium]